MLAGTASASALLGGVSTLGSFLTTPVLGEVLMLAVAIVLLRLLPQGVTGRFFRRAL
jgi:branched-subunit amino acid ABC-type transport system permease component